MQLRQAFFIAGTLLFPGESGPAIAAGRDPCFHLMEPLKAKIAEFDEFKAENLAVQAALDLNLSVCLERGRTLADRIAVASRGLSCSSAADVSRMDSELTTLAQGCEEKLQQIDMFQKIVVADIAPRKFDLDSARKELAGSAGAQAQCGSGVRLMEKVGNGFASLEETIKLLQANAHKSTEDYRAFKEAAAGLHQLAAANAKHCGQTETPALALGPRGGDSAGVASRSPVPPIPSGRSPARHSQITGRIGDEELESLGGVERISRPSVSEAAISATEASKAGSAPALSESATTPELGRHLASSENSRAAGPVEEASGRVPESKVENVLIPGTTQAGASELAPKATADDGFGPRGSLPAAAAKVETSSAPGSSAAISAADKTARAGHQIAGVLVPLDGGEPIVVYAGASGFASAVEPFGAETGTLFQRVHSCYRRVQPSLNR